MSPVRYWARQINQKLAGNWVLTGLLRRLVQVRAHQIAAVMEGDLAGEGGSAAAAIVGAADSVRAWTAGKGGAFYAQGEARSCGRRRCPPDSCWTLGIRVNISISLTLV